MTSSSCSSNPFSIHFIQRAWMVGALSPILLIASSSLAKTPATDSLFDAPSTTQASTPAAAQTADQPPITIPAGTRLTLVLTHPVDSRTTHVGDQISAQITAPVIFNE